MYYHHQQHQDQNSNNSEYDNIPITVLEHFDWPSYSEQNSSNGYEYLDERFIPPNIVPYCKLIFFSRCSIHKNNYLIYLFRNKNCIF